MEQFGKYSLIRKIGTGGMAEVFLARTPVAQGLNKTLVIKKIHTAYARSRQFVTMFVDEAKIALGLNHPNIIQVFDFGAVADTYFLAMEHVEGIDLLRLLQEAARARQRLPYGLSAYIVQQLAKGLDYAHRKTVEFGQPLGIVHRDISPPNILLSKNGEIKLVDFGLAKANTQIESTDQGVVKGKFSYLSPEAASGLEVDHRADVFAVGIILWEMFTGRRLFYGESDYQTVELVRQARVPSIAALNPEVEPELEAVVRKALAREPNDRYQSAADLGDALTQYLFSHRMKVSSRDIATLVRDAQVEMMRKRSAEPKESLIDALIKDEMNKMTSLVGEGGEEVNAPTEGEGALDPRTFVDTAGWAGEMGLQSSGQSAPAPAGGCAARPISTPRRRCSRIRRSRSSTRSCSITGCPARKAPS